MALLFAPPFYRATDLSNAPIPGAFIGFFKTQTSTPQPIYADVGLTVPLANPLPSDGNGVYPAIWLDDSLPAYKFVLYAPDQNDITIPGAVLRTGDPYNANVNALQLASQFWPQTPAEITQGVTPTFYVYVASPKIDPRRYGVIGDANPAGAGTDDTAAWQTAINMAYAVKGRILIPNGCLSKVNPLSLTMSGSATQPISIEGTSVIGSGFVAPAGLAAGGLLTFKSTAPATIFDESFMVLENFSIYGAPTITTGVHGLSLQGLAKWRLSNVRITGFDNGLDLQSCLTSVIDQGSEFVLNNTGIKVVSLTSGTNCNMLMISDSRVNLNKKVGLDYNGGSDIQCRGVNFERNGTTGVTATGGVFIRSGIGAVSQEAGVLFDGCWFESNFGYTFCVENNIVSATTVIVLKGGKLLGAEVGNAVNVFGASKLHIEDVMSNSPGDNWNLTATDGTLINVTVSILTDSTITYPTYISVRTGTSFQPNGRVTSFTGSLTGCTTVPAGSIQATQQGKRITLIFPSITGTSNSTAATITGLPAALIPSTNRAVTAAFINNSLDAVGILTIATSGTMTLSNAGGPFTGSGTKGIQNVTITYDL